MTEQDKTKPTESLLWRKGQKFNPDKIAQALGIATIPFNNPSLGESFTWTMEPEGLPPVRLEFFEKHRLFRVGIADILTEYQIRDYTADEMLGLESLDESRGLRVKAFRPAHFSMVIVMTSGIILEASMLGTRQAIMPNLEIELFRPFVPVEKLPEEAGELLTIAQCADRLHVPEPTVRSHIARGNLRAFRIGPRHSLVSEKDLAKLISDGRIRVLKK